MVAECDAEDVRLDRPVSERFAALFADDVAADDARSGDALPPRLAERFHVRRELGRGGMATVYLARDVRHERDVAVKVLRGGAAQNAARFLAEIRTTANLRHPHILPLFDSGEQDGRPFYVMPYVEGGSLRECLTAHRTLPADRAARVAAQIAGALHDAHQLGVVHRDIKPENILLTASGDHAYLADFGIALATAPSDSAPRATRTGFVVGTPAYMSPEQTASAPSTRAATSTASAACCTRC